MPLDTLADPRFSRRSLLRASALFAGGAALSGLPFGRASLAHDTAESWPNVAALADKYVSQRKLANLFLTFGWDQQPHAHTVGGGTLALGKPAMVDENSLYRIYSMSKPITGMATMILIDEGWKALDDEVFAARIRDWLKTLRKRNALVGFATQSARDALDSRISTALVEQTATMVFMPNSRARPEDYCDGFGLTGHELALIRTLPAHSRCFLVRQPDASVVVRLDLSGAPEVLTILSGRESAVRRLDLLRAAVGDAPADWYPQLTGRPWPDFGPDAPGMSQDDSMWQADE